MSRLFVNLPSPLLIEAELIRRGVDLDSIKFDPDQPRVPAGEPNGGQWTSEFGQLLDQVAKPDGGFTFSVTSHTAPQKGYALSLHKEAEQTFDAKDLTPKDLVEYTLKHWDLLQLANNYLGAWHNPEDDRVYLDVSTVLDSAQEAERIGREHRQLAYFDLSQGSSVAIKPDERNDYHGEGKATSGARGFQERRADVQRADGDVSAADGPDADAGAVDGSQTAVRVETATIAEQKISATDLPDGITAVEFDQLVARFGYAQAVAIIQARQNLLIMEEAIRSARSTSNVAAVMEASHANELPRVLSDTTERAMRESFRQGGQASLRRLRRQSININFNVIDMRSAEWAHAQAARLVTEINDSQRDTIRALIERSVAEGRTIQQTARDLRNVIGLRSDQLDAQWAYRERLIARGLDQQKIGAMVEKYAQAQVRQRALLIARTEVMSSQNAGLLAGWREAQDEGKLSANVRKQWIVTPDELLCEHCEPLGTADPIPLNEMFNGEVMHPPLHPNCRCSMGLVTQEGSDTHGDGTS